MNRSDITRLLDTSTGTYLAMGDQVNCRTGSTSVMINIDIDGNITGALVLADGTEDRFGVEDAHAIIRSATDAKRAGRLIPEQIEDWA